MITKNTLNKLIKELTSNKEALLTLAVAATGTPIKYHKQDLEYSMEFINSLLGLHAQFVKNMSKENILIKPKGKLLMVLSANEPCIMSFIPVLSALILGNELLLKSSSRNLEFNTLLFGIFKESGISNFRLVDIGRDDLSAFLDREQPDATVWFGSSKIVSAVAPEFAARMIEFIPECEGNDLVFVSSKSKDLKLAAQIVLHSLVRHQGQCCNAAKGILVESKIANSFEKLLIEESAKLKGGSLEDLGSDYFADKSINSMDLFKAKSSGPKIEKIKENFETYLQVNPFTVKQWLVSVPNLGTALKIAKTNKFGIGFTIFSDNILELDQVKSFITAARININRDPLEVNFTEPWGGTGLSGFGGARPWLDKFSNRTFLAQSNG